MDSQLTALEVGFGEGKVQYFIKRLIILSIILLLKKTYRVNKM